MQTVLKHLTTQQIVVLGLGITGLSCAQFLSAAQIPCTVIDNRAQPAALKQAQALPLVTVLTGDWHSDEIAKADTLFLSPGIDLAATGLEKVISKNCTITNDIELFAQLFNGKIIAVTGSNGKSTVVSLLAHIAKELGLNAVLAGNIGTPVLNTLNEHADYAILELSSFQLEQVTTLKANVACVLNISDDHLDRHKTMANYIKAKHAIYNSCQYAVVNRDDAATIPAHLEASTSFGEQAPAPNEYGLLAKNNQYYLAKGSLSGPQALISIDDLAIKGTHNALNCLAALAISHVLLWPEPDVITALKTFTGLAHRCQLVPTNDNKLWINDSKATNVGATLAAISGFSNKAEQAQKIVLIVGGDGKGADFSPLQAVCKHAIAKVICFGKDGKTLATLLGGELVTNLAEAVHRANELTQHGDMILLSPACASLDMFSNYQQRGEQFAKLAQEAAHG